MHAVISSTYGVLGQELTVVFVLTSNAEVLEDRTAAGDGKWPTGEELTTKLQGSLQRVSSNGGTGSVLHNQRLFRWRLPQLLAQLKRK